MTHSLPAAAFFIAAFAAVRRRAFGRDGSFRAPRTHGPRVPALWPAIILFAAAFQASAAPAPPLRFNRMPLGNVARILSARFHAPVTIAANATAPITGDFTALSLKAALEEAARQAGLAVVPAGTEDSAGYSLLRPDDPAAKAAAAAAAAAQRRSELLKRRAELLKEAARLSARP